MDKGKETVIYINRDSKLQIEIQNKIVKSCVAPERWNNLLRNNFYNLNVNSLICIQTVE